MIIRKIKLRNIKSYYGEHILDLPRPTPGKQLHLLGARNGSGKTTLFESINACLFASKANPILKANHLSRSVNAQEMEVEIEFEHEGQLHRLSRIWGRNPGRPETSANSVTLKSFLQNLGDNKDSSRDEDEITLFINNLIPHQISHFFLFDGEQIQEYTDAAADSVRDALERLLGLHHYTQLLEDLNGRVESELKSARDSLNIREDLNKRLDARDSVEARLKTNARNISLAKKAAREVSRELEALERRESSIDSVFDEQFQARRRELEERRDTQKGDIEIKESELKNLISNELIVSLFWPQIQQAHKELTDSQPSSNSPAYLEPEELIRFLWEQRQEIVSALREESPASLQNILMPSTIEESLYSEGIGNLARLVEGSSGRLWSTLDRINGLNTELNRTLHELNAQPSPDSIDMDVRALHQEMQDNRMILTRHERTLANLNNDEKQLKQDFERVNDDIRKLGEQDSKFQRLDAQLSLCIKIQEVLKRFISDYRSTRIKELEEVFNKKFRELTNTPETLGRVEIDRDTFDINVALRSETNLAASEGSAGQKEVLAFSLIASVVELSNKQLPIIIDTPLARLDVVHRDNILTKFFPYVGEQVIVLATDAEVGFEQHTKLNPYLASEHHLTRDADRTSIKEGYLVQ